MRTGTEKHPAAIMPWLLLFSIMAAGPQFLAGDPNKALAAEFIKPGSGVQVPDYRKAPKVLQVLRDGRVIHREGGVLAKPWVVSKELSARLQGLGGAPCRRPPNRRSVRRPVVQSVVLSSRAM